MLACLFAKSILREGCNSITLVGTRTQNLQIRSLARYPLRHKSALFSLMTTRKKRVICIQYIFHKTNLGMVHRIFFRLCDPDDIMIQYQAIVYSVTCNLVPSDIQFNFPLNTITVSHRDIKF